MNLEETLISVWRQALVKDASTVTLENRSHQVKRTRRSKLREVDFEFDGKAYRGWSRIRTPIRAGRKWREKARRLCSS